MTSIKTFKVDKDILGSLTKNEKQILPILIEVAERTDKIFLLQENEKYKGANLYPHDVTREQIEDAAKDDPKILSPFTVVKKNSLGRLNAVGYNTEYAKLLSPISELLLRASNLCQNQSFKRYLKVLAEGLTKGTYQQADIAWLAVKDSNIDITLGPYERYLDKLLMVMQ